MPVPACRLSSLLVLFLVALACAPLSAAQAAGGYEVLSFTGTPLRNIGRHIRYFDDPTQAVELPQAFERLEGSNGVATADSDQFAVPYGTSDYWGRFDLRNDTPGPAALRIVANIPWAISIELHVVRSDGSIDQLLARYPDTQFRPQDYSGTMLSGADFTLSADETVSVVFRYGAYGIGLLPLSVETLQSAETAASNNYLKLTVFYTFATCLLFLFIGLNIALQGTGTIAVGSTFVIAIFLLAQVDGLLFPRLWPDSGPWNNHASFYLLCALNCCCFVAAAILMQESRQIRARRLAVAFAVTSALPPLLASVMDVPTLTAASLFLLPPAVGTVTYATIVWAKGLRLQRLLATLVAIVLGALILIVMINIMNGSADIIFASHDLAKFTYFLYSLTLMIAFTARARSLSEEYRASLVREVEAARRDAENSRALLDSQRAFIHARELAERRRMQLAEASHDLRQPVAALRLAADGILLGVDDAQRPQIEKAFEYIERVLSDGLEKGRDDEAELDMPESHSPANGDEEPSEKEVLAVQLILDTVGAVFGNEARQKNLQLRIVGSSVETTVEPTRFLRIVSNLVKNAIKYTETGRVLVGVKRFGTQRRVVVIDTGQGMTAADVERFREAFEKSDGSDGYGLGLAIVSRLSREAGIEFDMSSTPGKGTCCQLTLPG